MDDSAVLFVTSSEFSHLGRHITLAKACVSRGMRVLMLSHSEARENIPDGAQFIDYGSAGDSAEFWKAALAITNSELSGMCTRHFAVRTSFQVAYSLARKAERDNKLQHASQLKREELKGSVRVRFPSGEEHSLQVFIDAPNPQWDEDFLPDGRKYVAPAFRHGCSEILDKNVTFLVNADLTLIKCAVMDSSWNEERIFRTEVATCKRQETNMAVLGSESNIKLLLDAHLVELPLSVTYGPVRYAYQALDALESENIGVMVYDPSQMFEAAAVLKETHRMPTIALVADMIFDEASAACGMPSIVRSLYKNLCEWRDLKLLATSGHADLLHETRRFLMEGKRRDRGYHPVIRQSDAIIVPSTKIIYGSRRNVLPSITRFVGRIPQSTEIAEFGEQHATMKRFLDNSTGCIVVSFGTMTSIPQETQLQMMHKISTACDINVLVVMRCLQEHSAGYERVLAVRFMPQLAVLKHPACCLFVTHGGANSVHESLSCGKPLLVVPFSGDQYHWAEQVCALGVGYRISPARFFVDGHAFLKSSLPSLEKKRRQIAPIAKKLGLLDSLNIAVEIIQREAHRARDRRVGWVAGGRV
jgi:UDP:flavonoid glycosyltransferase YjiC (YdhE family)